MIMDPKTLYEAELDKFLKREASRRHCRQSELDAMIPDLENLLLVAFFRGEKWAHEKNTLQPVKVATPSGVFESDVTADYPRTHPHYDPRKG